jgi:hypothetical protein
MDFNMVFLIIVVVIVILSILLTLWILYYQNPEDIMSYSSLRTKGQNKGIKRLIHFHRDDIALETSNCQELTYIKYLSTMTKISDKFPTLSKIAQRDYISYLRVNKGHIEFGYYSPKDSIDGLLELLARHTKKAKNLIGQKHGLGGSSGQGSGQGITHNSGQGGGPVLLR